MSYPVLENSKKGEKMLKKCWKKSEKKLEKSWKILKNLEKNVGPMKTLHANFKELYIKTNKVNKKLEWDQEED